MEDCNSLIRIKDWVSLRVPDSIFARGVAGVHDCNSAADISLCFSLLLLLLGFFFTLFYLQFIDKLVKLVETIVLLIDDHLILQHIFVVSDPYHCHHQLLSGQRSEFVCVQSLVSFTSECKPALLVRGLLQQVRVILAKLTRVFLLRYESKNTSAFVLFRSRCIIRIF